jgi:hypothetical protein
MFQEGDARLARRDGGAGLSAAQPAAFEMTCREGWFVLAEWVRCGAKGKRKKGTASARKSIFQT